MDLLIHRYESTTQSKTPKKSIQKNAPGVGQSALHFEEWLVEI